MEIDTALFMEMAAISRQTPMKEIMARGNSDVQRFYKNTTVLITGGTGFLGKQLIEKLLRSCDLLKMYVLLRSKKEMDVQTRFIDFLQDPAFETLRDEKPDFGSKIHAVNGDASSNRLGICEEDWLTLTNEVDIIFHLAATTKFDETLRNATLINIRGARETLGLAKACQKLRSFVYVSTAYSHATKNVINADVNEQFYQSPIPPETLISLAEKVEDNRLIGITPGIILNWPNTYTFTKAVAEEVVRTMSDGLPICIVRPGIVIASYREPSPGWLDISNVYGASGILVGSGVGMMHCIQTPKSDTHLGFIPCDYVNNIIIVAARESANNQEKGGDKTKIYNVTSARSKILRDTLEKHLFKANEIIPTPFAIYYNTVLHFNNMVLYKFSLLFLHLIPGYILDFACLLIGKKRRFIKIYTKMHKMLDVLSYFMLNEWNFVDNNLEKMFVDLKDDDKTIFNFDVTSINWKEYAYVWVLGIRKYIFKDGLKNTEYAQRKQFWFRILHYMVITIYSYGIWKIVFLLYNCMSNMFSFTK